MRTMLKSLMVVLVMLCLGASASATIWGPDLLNGAGDMEADHQSLWHFDNTGGFTTDYARNGSYSAYIGGPANSSCYLTYIGGEGSGGVDIPTVANRSHTWQYYVRVPGSAPSTRDARLNGDSWGPFSYGNTYFDLNNHVFQTAAGDSTLEELSWKVRAGYTHTPCYIDDVVLLREVADPVAESLSQSSFAPSASGGFSVFNSGGLNGEGNIIAFDPDATVTWVSGAAVDVDSYTWTSDNQLDVGITTTSEVGTAVLRITNPYGTATQDFEIEVTPEPTTMSLLGLGAVGILLNKRRK